MNSATLMTLREACGLTRSDFAGLIKSPKRPGEYIRERTVQYWENGRNTIPDDVARIILELDRLLTELANGFLENPGSCLELKRFRDYTDMIGFFPELEGMPVTCHAAMINRVRVQLDREVAVKWYGDN